MFPLINLIISFLKKKYILMNKQAGYKDIEEDEVCIT